MEKRAYEEVTKNPLHTNQCKAGFFLEIKRARSWPDLAFTIDDIFR